MDKKANKFIIILIVIIVADQFLKIWTKSNMYIGESIPLLGNWFSFLFVENSGMGLGIKPEGAKLALTIFRLVAIIAMFGFFIHFLRKRMYKLSIGLVFVLAGAVSNCLDNIFYGVIFSDSHNQIATLFPEKYYGKLFHGSIVDMFNLNIHLTNKLYINSVFNIADVFITIGLILLVGIAIKSFIKYVENKL